MRRKRLFEQRVFGVRGQMARAMLELTPPRPRRPEKARHYSTREANPYKTYVKSSWLLPSSTARHFMGRWVASGLVHSVERSVAACSNY